MTELKKYLTPEMSVTSLSVEDVMSLSFNTGTAAVDVEAGWLEDEEI